MIPSMRPNIVLLTTLSLVLTCFGELRAEKGTLLMHSPAVSDRHLAFVYAEDLWIANRDGSAARRLTSSSGVESHPVFSPDGRLLAFTGQYDGNHDVFVVPVSGGVPKRLTWHPGNDVVLGFTSDGQSVLFASARQVSNWRFDQFFTVPVKGGFPTNMGLPNGHRGSISPDSRLLAYNPLRDAFRQWKNYRGGTASRIWIFDLKTRKVVQIPQPKGRCNDVGPIWLREQVFFLSDRNGEFNLYHYDLGRKEVTQLTQYEDFPIVSASSGGGVIVYERAGRLYRFDPATKKSKPIQLRLVAEKIETRARFVKGAKYIRNTSISPTGKRVALGFRGEIVTVPGEKGHFRNITKTPGVHERWPAWSPDGKSIAYFSDQSGEYQLHIVNQDGKGRALSIGLGGHGFYRDPVWSPDSKRISFVDNAQALYWVDLHSRKVTKIAQEVEYQPRVNISHSWSPDAEWIAYTLNDHGLMQSVYLYSVAKRKSYRLTDSMSEASEPVFDSSGKFLFFFASTDAGPVKDWFAMSNADMKLTRSIYLAVLRKDETSPLAAESDEETGMLEDEKDKDKDKDKDKSDAKRPVEPTRIDLPGLSQRILSLPVTAGRYSRLQAGKQGELYYLSRDQKVIFDNENPKFSLLKFSLKKRKSEVVQTGLHRYALSADKKHILIQSGETFRIIPVEAKQKKESGTLKIDAIRVKIDPRVEWPQIFDEAWRINRDYFYATNYHGVDWMEMRKKYEVFVPHASCRDDLNRIIQWMCSELSVGHHRGGGGDSIERPESVDVGLLGADYEIQKGRYRFKKIYGGLNWNPDLKAPLTEPGVNVVAGEYLLAVDGQELTSKANLFSFFENTVGKIIELKIGKHPNGKDSRLVRVTPIADELALRNRDWVEANIEKVNRASGGRVAYVYVPNTTTLGHTYFKRYFYPQVHKQAIIVDERFNRGGQVADYYIDILRRPFNSCWAMRYGRDLCIPKGAIFGPKVMIIDETAGSGGDLLPWMFRKYGLGKLIGRPTWGGLVGVLGFPVLMDGGTITAPNLAIWTKEGWIVENEGVPPDIEVEQWPAQVMAGKDPQLDKALEVVLEELKKSPPEKLTRPPYPVRNRKRH